MAIVGGILLVIGAVLFFVRLSQLKKLTAIRAARRSTVNELTTIASAVAQDIGAGSWQDYVKVYGEVQCDQPLQSQVKQVDCAYFTTTVTRKYEEIVTEKDDAGKTTRKTVEKTDIVSQQKLSTPFWLIDDTGKVSVHPEDAEIETVKILSEFRPEQGEAGRISLGGFSLNLGQQMAGQGRTLGYQYEESILPIGREALVIGMATDVTKKLTIRKPSDRKNKFIVSLKTEGELTQGIDKSAKQTFYGMLGCVGAGVILLVMGAL